MPRELSTRRRYHKTPFIIAACALTCAITCAITSWSSRARAFDPFEIQVYDGNANEVGQFGAELHLNYVAKGVKTAEPPLLPPHHQLHATFEGSYGLKEWWELGAYLQSAVHDDFHADYAGAKLRSKFVTPPSFHPHVRLGVNVELSRVPQAYDPDRWGGELRPIVAWENVEWTFAFNPILAVPLAGAGYREGPSFEPAFAVYKKVRDRVSFGVEYYATLGPPFHPRARREQEHYLFGVGNLIAFEGWELNVGVGGGLTEASNGMILKTIMGHGF